MWFEKRIRQIAQLMRESGIEEIVVSRFFGLVRITVRRGKRPEVKTCSPSRPERQEEASWHSDQSVSQIPLLAGEEIVKSPSVGTFYLRSPEGKDASPMIREGEHISSEQILGWILALNISKAIQSEKAGLIKKILVTNESPIEYGQPLFIIVPD